MTYRKVGGLRFVRIGRFGFSWFVSKRKHRCGLAAQSHVTSQGTARAPLLTDTLEARMARAAKRRANLNRLRNAAALPDYPPSFNPYFEG